VISKNIYFYAAHKEASKVVDKFLSVYATPAQITTIKKNFLIKDKIKVK
jgi:hypothetical protein